MQGLADRLACSIEEADEAFTSYFAAYPAIAAWTRKTVAESKVTGYTQSRLGRRHPIWAYSAGKDCKWCKPSSLCRKHQTEYAGGERTAGNAPIQGALADMIKLIMIRCSKALADAGLKDVVRMCMNVHDALEFYVREDVNPQTVIDVLYPAIVTKTPWTEHWPVLRPDWHMWKRWGSPIELKLGDGNRILGMGSVIDIGTEEDEDDDEDDADTGAAPAVLGPPGSTLVQAARGLAGEVGSAAGDSSGPVRVHTGHVIVRLAEMPDTDSAHRFMRMLVEFPGPNTLELQTPEGSVRVSEGTSLSPEDGGTRISAVLGGAQVVWSADSVDSSVLAQGLEFGGGA